LKSETERKGGVDQPLSQRGGAAITVFSEVVVGEGKKSRMPASFIGEKGVGFNFTWPDVGGRKRFITSISGGGLAVGK